MRTVTKSNPEQDFFSFNVKTKIVCRYFASCSSEQEHLTHGMYMSVLIRPSDVKIEPIMFYEVINVKVFSHSIAFAILVVVTSRSSSFEDTISVHAGAERNVCDIVVSTETPPNFHQSISNAAPREQTSTLTPAPPQVLTSKTPQPFAQPFAQMRYNRLLSILCFFHVGIETGAQSVLGLCIGNTYHLNRKRI